MTKRRTPMKTSPGQSRPKSCENKKGFASHGHAYKIMKIVCEKRPGSGFMDVYQCKYCGLFHYGHAKGEGGSRSFRTVNAIDRALRADARKREKSAASV